MRYCCCNTSTHVLRLYCSATATRRPIHPPAPCTYDLWDSPDALVYCTGVLHRCTALVYCTGVCATCETHPMHFCTSAGEGSERAPPGNAFPTASAMSCRHAERYAFSNGPATAMSCASCSGPAAGSTPFIMRCSVDKFEGEGAAFKGPCNSHGLCELLRKGDRQHALHSCGTARRDEGGKYGIQTARRQLVWHRRGIWEQAVPTRMAAWNYERLRCEKHPIFIVVSSKHATPHGITSD